MIPEFKLYLPESVEEACKLRSELGPAAEIVAGGTDVYVKMHKGEHRPKFIIDIKNIPELKDIKGDEKTGLDIGSMVTHHEVETSDVVLKHYPVLFEGVNTIGSLQIRNRGTLGGNICTAAPSADGIGPLLVLNAICVVQGLKGMRTIPLEDFFSGPKQTVLKKDDVLVRILVPPVTGENGSAYYKYGRRKAMEIALMGITVYVEVNADGKSCSDARLALATSAPIPIRAKMTEAYLKGKDLSDPVVLKAAGKLVLEEAKPRSSWRSSAEFRRNLLRNLVPKIIHRAYRNVSSGVGYAE